MFSKRRHLLIAAAAFVLLLVAGWLYSQRFPMARLRASGAPKTLADLAPEPIPAELNAAAGIEELGPRLKALPDAFWNVNLADDPTQLAAARQRLDEHAEVVAAVIEAAKRPGYAATWVTSPGDLDRLILDAVVRMRSVFRVLHLELLTALGEGDQEHAAETAILMLDLADRVESEPFTTSRLVACAVQAMAIDGAQRAIAAGGVREESLDRIDQALAAIENRSSLVPTLESERVVSLERMRSWPAPSVWLYSGPVLGFFEEAIEAVDCPPAQRLSGAESIGAGRGPFAGPLADSVRGLATAEARTANQAREAREALREVATGLPPLEP